MIRYQPTYRVGTIRYEGQTNVGVRGPAGPGLEFTWDGTSLGVREQGQAEYQYVDLLGPEGKTGPEGKQGQPGPQGKAFVYEDFTPEQLLALVGPEGKSLEFTWNGTSLGVRVQGQTEYQYVDLKGEEGKQGPVGPQGQPGPIGPAFTYDDFTPEQLLALVGAPGVGIREIQRTKGNGAPGTIDTYTVTLTDGRSYDFFVYNGKDGEGAGDMTSTVYDPQGKKQDIFRYVDEKFRDIDVDVTADEVTFADGETFQQKHDEGKLTGPQGPAGKDGADGAPGKDGATGPAGAPGYTPQRGTDYWTADDQAEIVEQATAALTSAVRLTALPASGTTLQADAEYRVSAAVGTYQFAFPASGDVYVRFTTAAIFAISFASGTTYLGAVPKFEGGKTYELMARDKCVAVAEVVSHIGGGRYAEYVESTGTQCFNTNFKANQNTRVVIDFTYLSGDVVFGAYDSGGSNGFALQYTSGKWYTYYGSSNGTGSAATANKRCVVDINKNVATVDGTPLRTAAENNFSGGNPLLLSALYNISAPGAYSSIRLYSCQIYDNGVLVRDYRPYVDADDVVCLWDEVAGECVYSSGSGDLIVGEVIAA